MCSYGRADPRGTGEGRTAGIHEGIFPAPRSAGAKEAGQHRLLGAAICQNDRGGKAGLPKTTPLNKKAPREGAEREEI